MFKSEVIKIINNLPIEAAFCGPVVILEYHHNWKIRATCSTIEEVKVFTSKISFMESITECISTIRGNMIPNASIVHTIDNKRATINGLTELAVIRDSVNKYRKIIGKATIELSKIIDRLNYPELYKKEV